MFGKDWNSTAGLEAHSRDLAQLRRYVVDETAERLFELALIAAEQNGLDDFPEIMDFDEEGAGTPLDSVTDELAAIAEQHPRIVDAMRSSEDWDEDAHGDDASRAAGAAVSEAVEAAAGLWNDRRPSAEV